MPVELSIVESETELGIIVSQVVIESATAPGPPGADGTDGTDGVDGTDGADGEGVPVGGTAGQILTKDSGTDFDTSWQDPAAGSGVVETIVAGSNVDVDSTDPANPVVSMEALVDADIPASIARDAEVAAAYQPLDADLTTLAGAGNSAVLAATTASFLTADETKLDGIEAGATADQTAAEMLTAIKTVDGAGSGLDADLLDGLSSAAFATAAEPIAQAHIDDTTDAHDASAVSVADAGGHFTGTDVEAVLQELGAGGLTQAEIEEIARDALGTALVGGSGIDVTAVDGTDTITIDAEVTQAELDAKADDSAVVHDTGDETIAGVKTFSSDPLIPDEAYGVGWNGSLEPPTKNAVYDKIETIGGGSVDDTAYDATSWNGVTATAPSKNAVRDKVELLAPLASPALTGTPTAPTAAQGTNTTQLASTAYVQTEAGLLVPKSVLTTDGDLLTRAGGVPARITRASLAADAAFSGTYAPLRTQVFITAQSFFGVNGSPVMGEAASDVPAFLMDPSSIERVMVFTDIPPGWATYNIIAVWTNAGGGSGNVVMNVSYSPGFGDGESAAVTTNSTNVTATAPASGTAEFTTLETGVAVPSSGEVVPLRVARFGNDAADTLANDIGFIGLQLVKAS